MTRSRVNFVAMRLEAGCGSSEIRFDNRLQ